MKKGPVTHGHTCGGKVTALFSTWCGMIQRCKDTNRRDSKHYSLKGVSVCERWRKFENFLEDMGPSHSPGLTIHRKSDSLGYCPENVVWADWKTQNSESLHARKITLAGETKTVTQWCEFMAMPRHAFYNRIGRGWSIEEALTICV